MTVSPVARRSSTTVTDSEDSHISSVDSVALVDRMSMYRARRVNVMGLPPVLPNMPPGPAVTVQPLPVGIYAFETISAAIMSTEDEDGAVRASRVHFHAEVGLSQISS